RRSYSLFKAKSIKLSMTTKTRYWYINLTNSRNRTEVNQNSLDSKVIELINRHGGFLDANEISVLTKINYRRVKKDIQTLNECITKKR
ncbi:MAG: hypothetical protein WDA59_08770, partial [Methanofastidiosum sp.]